MKAWRIVNFFCAIPIVSFVCFRPFVSLSEIVQLDCFPFDETEKRLNAFGVDIMGSGRTKTSNAPEETRETGNFWYGPDDRWAYTYTNREGLECIVDYGEGFVFRVPEWAKGEPL